MAYQRPMVTVDQNITVAPMSTERAQPAFIFGPQFELRRYEDPNEKALTAVGQYKEDMEFPYPNVADEDAVDTSYTKLFGDNVVIALSDALPVEGYEEDKFNNKTVTKLDFENKFGYAVGTKLSVDVSESGSSSPSSNDIDETFTATVVGLSDDKKTVYMDQLVESGKSISVTPIDILDGVEFSSKNIEDMSGYWWEQIDDLVDKEGNIYRGVKVNKLVVDIYYLGERKFFDVISADLYLTYRELVTTYSDTLHAVSDAASVSVVLGAVSPDNPLAQGVYMACLNAATDDGTESAPVYFMAIPTNDKEGYDAVLRKLTLTDRVYTLAPVTRDAEVLEAVQAHVQAMSVKTVKKWRIAAVSAEIPSGVARLSAAMDLQNDPFYAIVKSVNSTKKTAVIMVVTSQGSGDPNPDTKLRSTVVAGDTVRFNFIKDPWDNSKEIFDEYEVKAVKNNYTVEVEDPYGVLKQDDESKIEIYHTYTSAESAELIASISAAMNSRRMYNVFPSVFSNNGVTMTGEFAACGLAGLISATEPQQPITNVTIRGIDDIPLVYQTYSNSELDVMAEGGTFIICQDLPNDRVYVRHQISTAYPDGNLNTAELSITKNVDDISYRFADAFEPYYGKYNIYPELLVALYNVATSLITDLSTGSSAYGPQLIDSSTSILYVRESETQSDHVDIGIRLGVPYPCNNIDIVLTV